MHRESTQESDNVSVLTMREPAWQERQEKLKLLNKVIDTHVSDKLSLRHNRGDFYESERNNTKFSEERRKRQSLNMRLRRGRLMHQRYYRSEKERLEAMEASQERLNNY